MEIERFETLAQAYGADLRRWPELERAAAEALLAHRPDQARAILLEAQGLDAVHDDWRAPVPSAALREAVMATAPRSRRELSWRGFGFWLSGAGFAAAALAGVVVGVAASNAAVSDARADALLSAALSNEGDTAATPFTVGSIGVRTT